MERVVVATLLTAIVLPSQVLPASAAPSSWRDGEDGTGAPGSPTRRSAVGSLRVPTNGWADLGSDDLWAKAAIDHVAGVNDWMRDYAPDADGRWRFRPDALETRARWARALVRAFAADEAPDPAITFPDIDRSDPFWPAAAIAVAHRWLTRGPDGRFNPDDAVAAQTVHRSLVLILELGDTAHALDGLSTEAGDAFRTPAMFGFNLLAMRLGLRFNNKVDEGQDVTPTDRLRRKQVAWSLYRATTLADWVVPYIRDQYEGVALPAMKGPRRSIVNWGVRYVGYPYIWGGEWGLETSEPPAFGAQPGPGFDCSGLSWWLLRRDDGPWQVSPPRPYEGWPLPQRTSAEMSRLTTRRLAYRNLAPGDLMFYDGDRDGVVDHVDVFVGNGWALDSSSSVGGVTLMWVRSGWYREHFVHGRRVLPKP